MFGEITCFLGIPKKMSAVDFHFIDASETGHQHGRFSSAFLQRFSSADVPCNRAHVKFPSDL